MSAKYSAASNEMIETVRTVINAFPEKFIHINMNDIDFLQKDDPKQSKWRGRVKLIREEASTTTKKKIWMCFWKQHWETSPQHEKYLIAYHELTHIVFDEEKNKYKIRKHDVESFSEVLQETGINEEKAEAFFGARIKTQNANQEATNQELPRV